MLAFISVTIGGLMSHFLLVTGMLPYENVGGAVGTIGSRINPDLYSDFFLMRMPQFRDEISGVRFSDKLPIDVPKIEIDHGIYLSSCSGTRNFLRSIPNPEHVKRMILYEEANIKEVAPELRRFKNLQHLGLGACKLDEKTFVAVLNGSPRLESLNLTATRLAPEHLQKLVLLRDLRLIVIAGPTLKRENLPELWLNDDLLAALVKADKLYCLSDFTAKDGARPRKNADVVKIDLSYRRIVDKSVLRLACCQVLEELNLSYTDITDIGISYLSTLNKLKMLRLNGTHIKDDSLDTIGALERLEELSMSGCEEITQAGFLKLQKSRTIRKLDLSYTNITEKVLYTLCQKMNLKEVAVATDLDIPNVELVELKKAFPKIRFSR